VDGVASVNAGRIYPPRSPPTHMQAIPIGTVQWRVFNAKKKLAPYLKTRQDTTRKAA